MTRLLLSLAGVLLLAVVALGVIWLVGQVLVGAGVLALGTAGVLLRLLWFLTVTASLGGLVYFVANAWRPTHQAAPPAHAATLPEHLRPTAAANMRVADLRVTPPPAVQKAAGSGEP